MHHPKWTEDVMFTFAECRARAAQKLAEAENSPRHAKKLRSQAECWTHLGNMVQPDEAIHALSVGYGHVENNEFGTLDRADRLFLADGLARGMSIGELAGFLNRSEDEIQRYVNSCSLSAGSTAVASRRASAARL
jgi:hypothetical protein